MTVPTSLLFVFGLGYSARALGERLVARGWGVKGTSRSVPGPLRGRVEVVQWDGKGDIAPPDGSHWLVTLPPDADGCPAARVAGHLAGKAASVTYLSTTGVYGDLDGGWAMEWSAVNPGSDRSKARVVAEGQWREATGGKARIVRLPGIYGPGRSPFEKLRNGTATRVVKPGQVFSRVHVDDIASGLEALMLRPSLSGVFHLCDDLAAPPQDVTAFAAGLLGVEPPPETLLDETDMSRMARSFYAECKRVSNARAKAALGWRPTYPSYREGLTAVLAAESAGC
ncbi:MAG: SDR family oxidoreductase [Alphaproteobacteria bacterium]|nr:SDR family oxidoreductase [Alphaproteobacteria bacterium]MBU2085283.1 SDR family oxidoreductase [Alphaproteobacteria bacterium]MBU2142378.1 SDR family oxidoreductase [Alphaproteobacteria bacterium]MBU2197514.1 SDR family oxidoreductase [Alphaproteobacteria bacterium]